MKMTWTVVGMLAGVSVFTAPVAHASPRGFNENHHWYCGHRRRTRPDTACACRRHPFYPSLIALALSPLVRLAINLISLTALLGLVLAPDAKADAEDYIGYLDSHGLGCGQGALKCTSDTDLIEVGRSVYDIDKNGQTQMRRLTSSCPSLMATSPQSSPRSWLRLLPSISARGRERPEYKQ